VVSTSSTTEERRGLDMLDRRELSAIGLDKLDQRGHRVTPSRRERRRVSKERG
jgi:hypothetical protein